MSHCITRAVLLAEPCGLFALCFSKSLRILTLSIACCVAVRPCAHQSQQLMMSCLSCRSPSEFLCDQFQHHWILGWHQQFHPFLHLFLLPLRPPFWPPSQTIIFNSIADTVEWILVTSYQIPDLHHYLVTLLGLPLHPGKCVGPSAVLVALGIELDSSSIRRSGISPPGEVVIITKSNWFLAPLKWCNRHEFGSLIGHLYHAVKVV